jgi:two-component sensor histidine kinase
VRLAGPEIELNASAAQTIGMAVHELATNACKYGALSNETGHVLVDWSLRGEDNAVFSINWSEREGPPVIRTNRKGFGQTVLLRLAEDALDAEVRLDYDPAGVQWRLRCPAENTLKT